MGINISYYLKTPNPQSFFTKSTDPKEVESIIQQLDTNKSVGPNSLPTKILKIISPIISKPLSNMCNKSFKTGIYPDQLKLSKINPTHKKDSKLAFYQT
jgi:hypothetical protein